MKQRVVLYTIIRTRLENNNTYPNRDKNKSNFFFFIPYREHYIVHNYYDYKIHICGSAYLLVNYMYLRI